MWAAKDWHRWIPEQQQQSHEAPAWIGSANDPDCNSDTMTSWSTGDTACSQAKQTTSSKALTRKWKSLLEITLKALTTGVYLTHCLMYVKAHFHENSNLELSVYVVCLYPHFEHTLNYTTPNLFYRCLLFYGGSHTKSIINVLRGIGVIPGSSLIPKTWNHFPPSGHLFPDSVMVSEASVIWVEEVLHCRRVVFTTAGAGVYGVVRIPPAQVWWWKTR